jgi:protein-S-isoprenylcysteine O-methyltransferase Ste14
MHKHASLGRCRRSAAIAKAAPGGKACAITQLDRYLKALREGAMDHQRSKAIAGSVLFLCVAPGVVAGLIPWWISGYEMQPALLGLEPIRWLGILLLGLGAVLLGETFARFALQGLGTPAPIAPTRTLVVTGSYRFVRNPMYVAVIALILGQALWLGSLWTLGYGLLVWLTVHLFVLAYEEPTLSRTFGAQYAQYRANVRRWIPRLTPWRG